VIFVYKTPYACYVSLWIMDAAVSCAEQQSMIMHAE